MHNAANAATPERIRPLTVRPSPPDFRPRLLARAHAPRHDARQQPLKLQMPSPWAREHKLAWRPRQSFVKKIPAVQPISTLASGRPPVERARTRGAILAIAPKGALKRRPRRRPGRSEFRQPTSTNQPKPLSRSVLITRAVTGCSWSVTRMM